ncbi:MAG TPA: ribonuclease Z [Pyrinomonadaceae bacterium]|nr:ribonuclease Z [Pyrinomonadaceae bacterium]
MKLVVLGSGTAVPHPRRSSSSHWVETQQGHTLLLDCAASAVHRMAAEGLDWAALDAIWISHFHLDHVGGLAPFLFGTRHADGTRTRTKPLHIVGPRGTEKLLRAFERAGRYKLFDQPFPIEVREVSPRKRFTLLPGLTAETFSTPHTRESLAVRLTETAEGVEEDGAGASLVYTSDTGYTESLARFARGAGLLLMECSFRDEKPIETHLVLSEAMRLARLAAPRRVLLSHLYPEWDGCDISSEARRFWDGRTEGAEDGLRLEIESGTRAASDRRGRDS